MPGMDIFNDDAFGIMTLTGTINDREFVPSMIRNMNLFRSRGVTTTTVSLERKGETLGLIQTSPRGAPPQELVTNRRELIPLKIPHLAKNATVYADEVQGVRSFGSDSELQTVQDLVNERAEILAREFDLTEEHMMLGALQGRLYDADGTLIQNMYSALGVSEPAAIDFDLSNADADVRVTCQGLTRQMGRAVGMPGAVMQVGALASDSFFDSLVSHPKVERAYERFQDGAALRENYAWESFRFGGVNFINYRGTDDNSKVAIKDGECRFFPMGVPDLFEIVYAPADYIETVNSPGLPRYVIPNNEDTGNGKYRKWEVQANPLPYCKKPQTLLKGTAGS